MLTTPNAESGLAIIQSERPDLVIFDIQLPGMSGIDAMHVIRNDPDINHIPAIAMSADASQESINKALDAGFVRYITKPIDIGELKEAIAMTLSVPTRQAQ